MFAKQVLDNYLTESQYEVLGQVVSTGYSACDKWVGSSIALSEFGPGMEHRSYLLNLFVSFALVEAASNHEWLRYEIHPNAARNRQHIRAFIGSLAFTLHYAGRKAERRFARKAVNRALLADRNGDLFSQELFSPDVPLNSSDPAYCQLIHGGWQKPLVSILAIPNRDQVTHTLKPHLLVLPEPKVVATEAILENIGNFKLRTNRDDQDEIEQAFRDISKRASEAG